MTHQSARTGSACSLAWETGGHALWAQALFILLVLIPVLLLARIPVAPFFRVVREPALLAFSTASSEAALPDALKRMVEFGVPRRIVSFVMPTGYSFNLDGTALYLSLTAISWRRRRGCT